MSYATDGLAQSTADVKVQRSTFRDPHSYKTTFNSGFLYPVYCREILPGDSLKIDSAFILRMLTPVVPVMDNAYIDLRFFFVPSRLLTNLAGQDDKTFQRMLGENISSSWANDDVSLPESCLIRSVRVPANGTRGTLWDYFGLPHLGNSSGKDVNISLRKPINGMPFFAYKLIWNEWYRNQNLQAPSYYSVNPGPDSFGLPTIHPFRVGKLHDVFTDALPSPQKGDDVLINFLSGLAPVVAKGDMVASADAYRFTQDGQNIIEGPAGFHHSVLGTTANQVQNLMYSVNSSNLKADLSAPGITSGSVNQLRTSFALQRQLEKDARGGTRYREKIMSTFGVEVPNGFLDIPEYLGGKRVPINIDSVLQTSATEGKSALGDTGAMSMTTDSDSLVDKSFFEYGYVLGLICVRTEQSYFQGINKCWRHVSRNDFYSPTFANIGEQPIMKSELYFSNDDEDDDVFGYQEAWYEYRHTPNVVTGGVNPSNGDISLSHWTYANGFESAPILNDEFNNQSDKNIGDTLVDTNTDTQFIIDLAFDDLISRAMPLYSVPGLIDHF